MSKPSLFRLVSNKTLFHFCLLIFINLTTYCFIYIDIFGVQSLSLGPGATTTSGMFFSFFFLINAALMSSKLKSEFDFLVSFLHLQHHS